MSDTDAKNNLRQALTNLRKIADDCLTITRDSIEFTGDCDLDSSKFESDIKSASSLDHEPASVILTNSPSAPVCVNSPSKPCIVSPRSK